MCDKDEPTSTSTDLDTHANMVVVGAQATIIQRSGRTVEVNPFADVCNKVKNVPIVDAAVAYDCPYTGETYLLIMRNALYVPSMDHNLIPPFIMREAGLTVNDVPRIHCGGDVTRESHCIVSKDPSLRIPLRLNGVFSQFTTRALSQEEEDDCDHYPFIMLTPDSHHWNPHDESYADNEENFLDWEGELVDNSSNKRKRDIISDDEVPEISEVVVDVDRYESVVDAIISQNDVNFVPDPEAAYTDEDTLRAQVCDLTACFNDRHLQQIMEEKLAESKFSMAIGSTTYHADNDEDCELFMPSGSSEISATHAERPKGVSKEQLSKIWRIPEDEARRTLEVTTQLNQQDAEGSLSRRFSTNDRMLRYKRIASLFFTDTFFAKGAAKSLRGFTCMQLFISDKGYMKVYGMTSPKQFKDALKLFCKEVGVPKAVVCDPHRSNISNEVKQFCHHVGTTLRSLEEGTQHANRAELYIGLLKESVRKDIRETHCPLRLWCYCAERRAQIFNMTAKKLFQLEGQNPHLATFGEMGDISNLCNFGWYEWCYYRQSSKKVQFPQMKEALGRCLGPTKNEGNEMCQWVLQMNGKVVPRRTLRKLTPHELSESNVSEVKKRADFDEAIRLTIGDSFQPDGTDPEALVDDFYVPYEDDEEEPSADLEADIVDASGKPINQQSANDLLINAEVLLPQGESMHMAKVIRRAVDDDGQLIGTFDENPVLNSMLYDVQFPDGVVKQYAANIIAENILYQVDKSGHQWNILDSIIDVKSDESAVTKDNAYVVSKRGRRSLRQTTIGWKFQVQWKDGTKQWVPLKLMKESNPLHVAEFVTAKGIADEPAFAWWVPYTLKKRERIIAAVSSRVAKRTHKFGIEVPTSIEHARELDKKNGNRYWQDAIAKEMYNISVAFEILEEHEHLPVGYKKSSGHWVFDVKMDFTRKARWVKDGHKHPDPETSSYAGVVSRESIRILLTYAALNGLDVMAADIRNAYLQAPTSDKHYIICGEEFGLENVGKRAKIVRALYGGKSSGRDFWVHLRECMEHLGFKSSHADPDVWMRPTLRPDGSPGWEYVLLYTDDALVISDNPRKVLEAEIGKYFELKKESIGPPTIYLGGQMRLAQLDNGNKCWAFGSSQYVQAAVKNVEAYLEKKGQSLPRTGKNVLPVGYRPEVDISDECDDKEASYYQSLIGILRWMVEIGRVDICVEVSMMSSHLALPRVGHLEKVLHIFGYLKKHHNAEMPFDPSYPEINEQEFVRQDWSNTVYGDVKEELPPNMPEARGRGFVMRCFVDSDHAGESVTRRSRTGFLVFLNCAPIYWLSKKQTSCETSTFGSEFVAMKQATEYVRGLRYKLRMFGIPCEDPTFIYGDNQSVLANTSVPDSQLKKKSNSIAYHFVRDGCARDEWRTTYVNTHDNPADLMTKPLSAGEKRTKFVRMLLWWLES